MTRARALTSVSMVLAAVLLAAAAMPREHFVPTPTVHGKTFDQQSVWRTWKIYCDTCHFGPKARAGLNLEALDLANLGENGAAWEKVLRKLRSREMPPAGVPRPDAATYTALVEAIETERDRLAEIKPNPGRATLHRLNRAEYANAIRDLLALDVDVAELLPADDIGYGFDNIADVLQVSPLLLERYLAAATKISALATGDTELPVSYQTYDVPRGLVQLERMGEAMPLGSRGGASIRHRFPVDGEYEISVGLQRGRFDQFLGLERERKLDLRLDGERLELFTIPADQRAGRVVHGTGLDPDSHLKVRVPVKAGTRTLVATFVKDTVKTEGIPPNSRSEFFRRRRQHFGRRALRCAGAGRHGEPRQDFRLPSYGARRGGGLRGKDHFEPRAPRLPSADCRRRSAAPRHAVPTRCRGGRLRGWS